MVEVAVGRVDPAGGETLRISHFDDAFLSRGRPPLSGDHVEELIVIGEPDPPISVFGISHDLPREVGEDRSPSGNLPGVVVQAEECCQIGPDVHHRRLRSRAPALIPAGEEVEVDVGSDLIDAPSLSIALAVWAKRLILNIAALASPAGRSNPHRLAVPVSVGSQMTRRCPTFCS